MGGVRPSTLKPQNQSQQQQNLEEFSSPTQNDQNDQNDCDNRKSAENQIENYLQNLEKQIQEANEEKISLLEENKDLKNKLLELSQFLTENEKSKEEKDLKIRESVQKLIQNNQLLEKENTNLREEIKSQLKDKTEVLERMQKYDKLVDELKSYNQELLNTVKQYEEQNKLLKQQTGDGVGLEQFKQTMAVYEEKINQLGDLAKKLEEEKMKSKLSEEKYLKAMEINEILNKKIEEMQQEMVNLQTTFKKVLDDENGTKDRIKTLVEGLQGQVEFANNKLDEKNKENLELVRIIEQYKEALSQQTQASTKQSATQSAKTAFQNDFNEIRIQDDGFDDNLSRPSNFHRKKAASVRNLIKKNRKKKKLPEVIF